MRLPPLNALRAFEAAARHNGFIGASEELHVTRGAISRHVKLLEEHLGVPLFIRQAQGVRLTPAGRRLLPVLTDCFGRIARETERLATDANELRVICPPATSIRWLIPKLEAFRARHPDITLRLTTDFHGGGGFDVVKYDIGFSVMNWPNRAGDLEVQELFPVQLTPACAPRYLSEHGPFEGTQDLARATLLHETQAHADWRAWGAQFVPDLDAAEGLDFPNLDMATKAAVMGAGMVMADLVLCREELQAGVLVAPFSGLVASSPLGGICMIGACDQWHTTKVTCFRDWAINEAAADRTFLEAGV